MFLKKRLQRLFGNGAGHREPQTDIEGFINDRRGNLAQLGDEEIERRSQVALSKVDKEKTLREATALREQWKEQPERRVHHRTE